MPVCRVLLGEEVSLDCSVLKCPRLYDMRVYGYLGATFSTLLIPVCSNSSVAHSHLSRSQGHMCGRVDECSSIDHQDSFGGSRKEGRKKWCFWIHEWPLPVKCVTDVCLLLLLSVVLNKCSWESYRGSPKLARAAHGQLSPTAATHSEIVGVEFKKKKPGQ